MGINTVGGERHKENRLRGEEDTEVVGVGAVGAIANTRFESEDEFGEAAGDDFSMDGFEGVIEGVIVHLVEFVVEVVVEGAEGHDTAPRHVFGFVYWKNKKKNAMRKKKKKKKKSKEKKKRKKPKKKKKKAKKKKQRKINKSIK